MKFQLKGSTQKLRAQLMDYGKKVQPDVWLQILSVAGRGWARLGVAG
jgi:hypothetical protein